MLEDDVLEKINGGYSVPLSKYLSKYVANDGSVMVLDTSTMPQKIYTFANESEFHTWWLNFRG